jgi:hypothetical protein
MSPIVVLILATCGLAGWAIARHEVHPIWGACVGVLLGPLGVGLVAVSGWFAARRRTRLSALAPSSRQAATERTSSSD